jgi:hypothetical protein
LHIGQKELTDTLPRVERCWRPVWLAALPDEQVKLRVPQVHADRIPDLGENRQPLRLLQPDPQRGDDPFIDLRRIGVVQLGKSPRRQPEPAPLRHHVQRRHELLQARIVG